MGEEINYDAAVFGIGLFGLYDVFYVVMLLVKIMEFRRNLSQISQLQLKLQALSQTAVIHLVFSILGAEIIPCAFLGLSASVGGNMLIVSGVHFFLNVKSFGKSSCARLFPVYQSIRAKAQNDELPQVVDPDIAMERKQDDEKVECRIFSQTDHASRFNIIKGPVVVEHLELESLMFTMYELPQNSNPGIEIETIQGDEKVACGLYIKRPVVVDDPDLEAILYSKNAENK